MARQVGYSDLWVIEASRPRIIGYPTIEGRIRRAEAHLAARRFPEAVHDLSEAWDLFMPILTPQVERRGVLD